MGPCCPLFCVTPTCSCAGFFGWLPFGEAMLQNRPFRARVPGYTWGGGAVWGGAVGGLFVCLRKGTLDSSTNVGSRKRLAV